MRRSLVRYYWILLIPGVLFSLVVIGLISIGLNQTVEVSCWFKMLIFSIVVANGLIFPIWWRILYFRSIKTEQRLSKKAFIRLQRGLILSACLGGLLLPIAYILGLSRVPMVITILIVLYAVYYYYPCKRRIQLDTKLFGLKEW